MKRTVSQILQEGRARIAAPGGWTQYQMRRRRSNGTAYCAVGALYPWADLRQAVGEGEAIRQAREALERGVPEGVGIGDYNDNPDRTRADILGLYDRALTEVTK